MKDFYKDKVVVISGASSGMGRDLAALLASWGAHLAVTARRQPLLDELRAECEAAGAQTLTFACDVTDEAAMLALRDAVLDKWGRADVVIANAGVGGLNPGDNFSLEIHRKVVEINAIGLANTLIPFVPSMIARRQGHLVGISSLAAFRGLPNAASYSSSKAAQMVFLESLRVDLRKHHVAVSCIHPGFIESPMTEHDEFRMPFKMPVRESSVLIAKAIADRKASYLYPWQMRMVTAVNKHLPRFLYDTIVPRLSGQKEHIAPRIF